MTEPQTEAGKALHDWLGWHPVDGRDRWIAQVEAEAIAIGAKAERERLYAEFKRICETEATEDGMLWPQDIDDLLAEPEAGP